MSNSAAYLVLMQQMQFPLARAVADNSVNQFTRGTAWALSGGPTVTGWTSGPSTCINNVVPCVANAAASAFTTNANFGRNNE